MGKIKARESQNVEYKRSWQDKYLEWICGFANARGAVMYFGVDDDHEVVGVLNSCVALVGYNACSRVKTECLRSAEQSVPHSRNALHASNDFVAVCCVACAFPFGHPVACVCQPIGADAQTSRCGAWIL